MLKINAQGGVYADINLVSVACGSVDVLHRDDYARLGAVRWNSCVSAMGRSAGESKVNVIYQRRTF